MSIIKSPEFFINQKKIPTKDSVDYDAFFLEELRKITYGLTVDGVYIHGWLYWHLNHWNIYKDVRDELNGEIIDKLGKPDLRDNEWIIAEHLKMAEEQQKGLMILGSRRLGKSFFEASWIGRGASIYEGSQNVIGSTNSGDLKIVTSIIEKGLSNIHPYFRHGRINDNWNQEVTLGFKDKKGVRYEWSKIAIRNLADGKATEAFAGLKPKTLVIDEALEENELIYTENGIKTIKDVNIGESIYDDKGELTKVIDKINPGIVDIYEFTLSDGRKIKSSDNHIWKVYSTYRKQYLEYTTEKIRQKYFFIKKDNRYNKSVKSFIYSLPKNSAIKYSKKDIKIDPYWLGLWLGDGFKCNTSVCSIDDEIINYCSKYAKKLGMKSRIDYNKIKGDGKFRVISIIKSSGSNNKLRDLLRNYNLYFNKHIPEIYLTSSIEDRIELLKGLMDTDGSVSKQGVIEFSSSQIKLAQGIERLLRELGINFYLRKTPKTFTYKGEKKIGEISWRFHISTDLKLFKLSRKLNNYNMSMSGVNKLKSKAYKERDTIINIQYIGQKQAYCLKVDNKSKLFLTTDCIVTHNCGKAPFSECFEAAKPSFSSQFGWRCVPIICGTGGTLANDTDAEKYFKNPESNNFLALDYPNKKQKYGLFISGLKRMEGKVQKKFGEFLETSRGILVPKESEIYNLDFFDTDEPKAKAVIQHELDMALDNNDSKAYLKQRMYFPQDPDDCFLTDDGNDFPLDALREHLNYLELSDPKQSCVTLYKTPEGVIDSKFAPDFLKPIYDFPIQRGTIKDAPIVIFEEPIPNPTYGLYISGADPYNQSQSKNSESLGSIYIYKRMSDAAGGTFQDSIVASYTARPNTMREWHENAEMLLEYYNAICMPENEGGTFIQYFDQKNKAHMLADGVSFLKTIAPNSSIEGRIKGLPATVAVQKFWMNLIKEYLKELIQVGEDENKAPIFKMGLIRILDKALLKEFIAYKTDKGNYDRIYAFGHALACNVYFNKLYPNVKIVNEEEEKKYIPLPRSPFLFKNANPFSYKKSPF